MIQPQRTTRLKRTSSLSRKFLYLARKTPAFLPENYKKRRNTTVIGKSASGEVSPKGLVAHTEDWEGRVAATAAPSTICYTRDPDGRWRPMTLQEMIAKGLFIVGKGPRGVRSQREGVTS